MLNWFFLFSGMKLYLLTVQLPKTGPLLYSHVLVTINKNMFQYKQFIIQELVNKTFPFLKLLHDLK